MISTGTMSNVMGVAKSSPHAMDRAAGIRYCACSDVSNSSGISPHTVVTVVRKMARSRVPPACSKDVCRFSPLSLKSLNLVIITRLSLTTTPMTTIIPKNERMESKVPVIKWPITAPTKPKGMTDMITNANGCQ